MKLEYRRIRVLDVPAITELALDALRNSETLPLHVSPEKVEGLVRAFALDSSHFNMATFVNDHPIAGLAAFKVESPFFERSEAHVMMCWSIKAGAGTPLIRRMIRWFREDASLRRLVWAMNSPASDPIAARMTRLVQRRYGFDEEHKLLLLYK